MRVYSPFFQTLYDEEGPVGTNRLGRGAHYSILRGLTHWNHFNEDEIPAVYQDLAIIWDEDHDVRVIQAIEDLHRHRLLHPVLFVGEAKGTLSVVLVTAFPKAKLAAYEKRLEHVAQSQPDPWSHTMAIWCQDPGIVGEGSSSERAQLYLNAIDMLWKPGLKPVVRPTD